MKRRGKEMEKRREAAGTWPRKARGDERRQGKEERDERKGGRGHRGEEMSN